ncbi:MAG: tRNA lysidine(34) synthetase TilS [Rhodopirellula sp.]|nr:tRNA lysidine(34) synthetase TilS [Rhodopirellula sp.]
MNSRDRRSNFLTKLLAGLKRCGFEDGRVLVGVSGGADSVALLRGLAHWRDASSREASSPPHRLEIVVAHIDHQIREDSQDDADWVQSLADELVVKCRIEAANVRGRVAETGESLEEAARRTRYETLASIAQEEGCTAIAVAHTADDQAETVLHHLIRGTSVTGLRGMLWARPVAVRNDASDQQLIRPMLEIRRAELELWLQDIHQNFRTDPTNSDEALTRNRIRHQLLSTLERDFNPQIRKALGTLAGHAAEVSDLLRGLAEKLADSSVVQLSENSVRVACPALADQPPVLIRETLLTIWQQADWPLKRMGHREWQKLADLVMHSGGAVSLPERIEARRRGQLLILSRET